jgi:hypothetical protein
MSSRALDEKRGMQFKIIQFLLFRQKMTRAEAAWNVGAMQLMMKTCTEERVYELGCLNDSGEVANDVTIGSSSSSVGIAVNTIVIISHSAARASASSCSRRVATLQLPRNHTVAIEKLVGTEMISMHPRLQFTLSLLRNVAKKTGSCVETELKVALNKWVQSKCVGGPRNHSKRFIIGRGGGGAKGGKRNN